MRPLHAAYRTFMWLAWRVALAGIIGVGFAPFALCLTSSVPAAKFEEHLLGVVPVSGSTLVGVQYMDSTMPDPESLWVYLPYTSSDRLCVSVVSDDGIYTASAEYLLQGVAVGPVTLSFPTKKKADLTQYGAPRLSLLAAVRKTCDGVDPPAFPKIYLPLAWSRPSASQISVLVNAPDMDVQIFDSATRKYTDCRGTISKTPVAFGTACTLTIGSEEHDWQGYIVRSSFQEALPQVPLHIGYR